MLDRSEEALSSLGEFIKAVAPGRILGAIHNEVIEWWERQDRKDHQLLLLPRGHQKSALVAYRVAYWLTKDPTLTFLYLSATTPLAEKQLRFIKNIMQSDNYQRLFPDMIAQKDTKRERWTAGEIIIDHPLRAETAAQDPSVFTAGLNSNVTGFHCDIAVMDDVVIYENAYTSEGRRQVKAAYSLLSSIENPGAKEWVVGTRYDPRDLYNDLLTMSEEVYNKKGEVVDHADVYECFIREVEDKGDGTGEFIWPKQQAKNGRWYGFDSKILARKRAQYLDKRQFRAQYYNDPNDYSEARIDPNKFQYYDRKYITNTSGIWYYKDKPLTIYAGMDFSYSTSKSSDYSAIVVVGVTPENHIFVLDTDRFKTDKISEFFDHIRALHRKWLFRKLRTECTSAQKPILEEIKNQYIKPQGMLLAVDYFQVNQYRGGSKEERISAILEPRYDSQLIWHYRGGRMQLLEEELVLSNPPHDDMKDAMACATDKAQPMSTQASRRRSNPVYDSQTSMAGGAQSRFGGVS